MIKGIGTDILEIERIAKVYSRWGGRFGKKILTPFELERMEKNISQERFIARRFCAKEAVSKALGTGMKSGVSFPQIEIRHDKRGAPLVKLSGRAQDIFIEKQATDIKLSISDEKDYALAFAVMT